MRGAGGKLQKGVFGIGEMVGRQDHDDGVLIGGADIGPEQCTRHSRAALTVGQFASMTAFSARRGPLSAGILREAQPVAALGQPWLH